MLSLCAACYLGSEGDGWVCFSLQEGGDEKSHAQIETELCTQRVHPSPAVSRWP